MVEVKCVVVFYLLMAMAVCVCHAAGRSKFSGSSNAEIQKILKRLNKPAVKSIKSPDGDIIDCVHILHQPAFDHPLLKNHTIQMTPNYYQDDDIKVSAMTNNRSSVIPQLWHLTGKCPKGTIPIRRTKKEDILGASSIKSFGQKSLGYDPTQGHEYATAGVQGTFHGTKATLNVWNPRVEQRMEFSLGQIWISGGSYDTIFNSIEVGWHVDPNLYIDDYNTRLFIYWTADSYQSTGCHDLKCPGFVQTSNEIAMGATIAGISQFDGPQYDITIYVWKDPMEGNWWLQIDGHTLGYWPANLFSQLSTGASEIQWGGEVINQATNGQHTTTQMGSGQFAQQGYGKASYFKNIQVVDQYNNLIHPKGHAGISQRVPSCYDIQMGDSDVWGNYFYYGGPGRNPYCP